MILPRIFLCLNLIIWTAGRSMAQAQTRGLLFDQPASSLEESYRGKYGKADDARQVDGPYFESDESSKQDSGETSSDQPPSGLFSLGIGLYNGFSADISYTYFYNRFFGTEYGATYSKAFGKYNEEKSVSESYGPRLMFIFQATNPTIVTPVLAAGPTFEFWNRQIGKDQIDDNQSLRADTLVGMNLKLSKYFILQLAMVGRSYLFEIPKRIDRSGLHEDDYQRSLQLRFFVQL
jgi:hypothetical protein